IAQIAQALPKLPPKLLWIDIANDECADDRQPRRLLRARHKRPRDRPAEQGDEIASFQLIESHPMPISRGWQDIGVQGLSQRAWGASDQAPEAFPSAPTCASAKRYAPHPPRGPRVDKIPRKAVQNLSIKWWT